MITKLFLFTASLLLLACSNDDKNIQPEEQNIELKIKSYVERGVDENGNLNGDDKEWFFDESGKIEQRRIAEIFYSDVRIIDYAYNNLDQIIEHKTTFLNSSGFATLKYYYDSEKKLDYISEILEQGVRDTILDLIHTPDTIKIIFSPSDLKILIFENNILKQINEEGDLGYYGEEMITYDGSQNIIDRTITGNSSTGNDFYSIYEYEYDDKVNPLYPYFNEHPLNFLEQPTFSLNYYAPFISPNNFTKYSFVTDYAPDRNFIITRDFQYNNDGYPVSSEIKKNGVLISKGSYEYY